MAGSAILAVGICWQHQLVVALRAHAKELNTGHLFPCIFPLYNDLAEDLAGKI